MHRKNPYVGLALLPTLFIIVRTCFSILLDLFDQPYPQVDPNFKASGTISHRESQWCHLNDSLMVVVAHKLENIQLLPTFMLVQEHTYPKKPSKFGLLVQ
jgi:hypothetical protein